eukprot:6394798-Amphidinium_carterae.1
MVTAKTCPSLQQRTVTASLRPTKSRQHTKAKCAQSGSLLQRRKIGQTLLGAGNPSSTFGGASVLPVVPLVVCRGGV